MMQVLNAIRRRSGFQVCVSSFSMRAGRMCSAAGYSRTRDNYFARLRAVERGRNIFVDYAAKHGMVAMDGDVSNFPYTKALMQHVHQPCIGIMDMFRDILYVVLESTRSSLEAVFVWLAS